MPADKQRAVPRKQGATPYARPHACPHCAAAFGKPSALTVHVRTVHEKRRDHVCPHCAAAFGHASSLVTHVRTQHPDNSQDEVADCPSSLESEAAAVMLSADHILAALLR